MMNRRAKRVLATWVAASAVMVGLAAPAVAARPTTDKVTTGSWGQGVAVVDPTVAANDLTPSDVAAVNLKITLTDPTLSWDNGPGNVIGGCGAPGCLPETMLPGIYKFPYVAGSGGVVAGVGGHFTLTGDDARGRAVTITLTIQSDTGFANLPAWAAADQVSTGTWGQGVAVVDPTVPANDVTPSDFAAVDLAIRLTQASLSWDDGHGNGIGGCGAPNCLPEPMLPGIYKFPYVAGSGGPVANVGGHFTLSGYDAKGKFVEIILTVQSDPGFSSLPAWAAADQVSTGTWGQGVAVVDPSVPANDVTPSDYAAVDLSVTLTDPTLSWDNGPDNVIGGCGAPGCLPETMTPGVYKFPYVAGTGGVVANVGGHFTLSGQDAQGRLVTIVLTIQSDPGFADLPSWATP